MSKPRVLIVDDERDMRDLLVELLTRAGHATVLAENGLDALRKLHDARPELVLLDVRMPVLDGWATLERIRDVSDVPVLMLTAQGDELEKVRGLRAGADDYLAKPFGRQELLARIDALLRRSRRAEPDPERYADGWLTIEHAARSVVAGDREVSLTPLEYRLLLTLCAHAGNVLSPDQLLEHVWGGSDGNARESVKLYVGYLRRKLGPAPGGNSPIETVRGFGYRYRPPG